MCGRYTSTTSAAVLVETFEVDEIKTDELPPRFNVAPSQPVYAVAVRRARPDGGTTSRQLGTFLWGLIPSWAAEPVGGARMINARAETVAVKPAYREALVRRRCIIPADAFYEWQARPAGGRRVKVPYAIRRKDGQPLAFAGLWELWRPPDPDASPVRSCTIITTAANELLAPIHDRMPVVLPRPAWDAWLDPSNHDVAGLQKLLVPLPPDQLELWPVTSRVNDVAHDGPELLEPAADYTP